jgi:plasmid maintenance system killer protein
LEVEIENADSIHDLISDRGLHFEKLSGFKNLWSMRLTIKYRLEMNIIWLDEKQTSGTFYLTDITNHYGD